MWGAGWGYWGWGWWFWVFWIILVFVIGSLIAGSGFWGGRRTPPPEEQILRERYARGEITKQEFDQKLGDLRHAA